MRGMFSGGFFGIEIPPGRKLPRAPGPNKTTACRAAEQPELFAHPGGSPEGRGAERRQTLAEAVLAGGHVEERGDLGRVLAPPAHAVPEQAVAQTAGARL